MNRIKERTNKQSQEPKEFSLKGTFISVMLVGIFIIVSWFGVYALFVAR